MNKKTIIKVCTMLLILLFVYAAVSKLLDYQRFEVQLAKSPLINTLSPIVAVVIPVIELITAILLLFSRTQLAGLYFSLALMVSFTVYLIQILNFSSNVPCSCGGILQGFSWTVHIFFNLFFIAITVFALLVKEIKPEEKLVSYQQ